MSTHRKKKIKTEILGIICARARSKGLKDKHILPLMGKPMIYYTIQSAKNSKLIGRVVCSTDGKAIAGVVKQHGVEVIKRPSKYAADNSPIEEALRYTVEYLKDKENYYPDYVVLLQANVPVRAKGIIDKAIMYIIKSRADSVFTAHAIGKYHSFWQVRKAKENKLEYFTRSKIYRRQDLPQLYYVDDACYVIKTSVLMKRLKRDKLYSVFGKDIRLLVQKPEETVDVDDSKDMFIAEAILKYKKMVQKK